MWSVVKLNGLYMLLTTTKKMAPTTTIFYNNYWLDLSSSRTNLKTKVNNSYFISSLFFTQQKEFNQLNTKQNYLLSKIQR